MTAAPLTLAEAIAALAAYTPRRTRRPVVMAAAGLDWERLANGGRR